MRYQVVALKSFSRTEVRMTRKLRWYLLLCLAELTILPGCQHLPYFGCRPETAYEIHENPNPINAQNQVMSTAQMPDRAYPTSAKPGPTVEAWLAQQDALDKKKQNAAATGIVTTEASTDPKSPPMLLLPTTPPLPKIDAKQREYADLVQALQDMLDGRHEDAMKHLRKYDGPTQELFLRLLPPLTNLVKKPLDDMSPQEVTVLINGFRSFIETLTPRSELKISKMEYCKWVKAFGNYQSLPENHAFLTGAENRLGEEVQLYVELANFESKQTKDGDYLTKLACTLELHDSENKKVWERSVESKNTTHRSRSPMNDFYSNYSFYVPIIPAGAYKLTIRLTDETNPDAKLRRTASESLVFRVTPAVSQPPLR
jgi:hypothetical protein